MLTQIVADEYSTKYLAPNAHICIHLACRQAGLRIKLRSPAYRQAGPQEKITSTKQPGPLSAVRLRRAYFAEVALLRRPRVCYDAGAST